ncbi:MULTISPECIES: ATP-binding protein [Streptomyces]|uniref:Helicase loader DnaI n=1 Tax=Streptomyces venezuelae (strain ATCC 10712 / CBS 650.69 / DSM 40230 / JCM 4526 / NBRC 13096 / PD 04745) TaxID=953739 RepID=F2RKY7_STRVP|nr:ATP-binding protein [Streptomyces venezuelae]APE21357.1 ATP-binding protein [Streptomyces venezuelae]QER98747.1 ATP-binding protein [Streptomyces venezuelae ATCC 10712]CCA55376.1 Helicase loader DnaI [Streptomyces venezuelae ATCC 10712]
MPEPSPAFGGNITDRLQRALAARGLDQIDPGPIDNTPAEDEPGHPEYHRRRRAEWNLKRWAAVTPYRYQHATCTHPALQQWADKVAADPRSAGFLLLTGTFGTGKTHESYGAFRRIADAGPDRYEVIATTAPDMYALMRPGGSERGTEYEVKRLKKIPLLLIDDLGTEKVSEFTEEATYRLLNERYNESLPTLITSNLPADSRDQKGVKQGPDLIEKLGERIADRLREITRIVPMDGPSRRRGAA